MNAKWWTKGKDLSDELIRRHAIVTGMVQHVGFRWSASYFAASAQVTGWIRNLPTGQVEVEFQGRPDCVAYMEKWLSHGPRGAFVEKLEVYSKPVVEGEKDFRPVL